MKYSKWIVGEQRRETKSRKNRTGESQTFTGGRMVARVLVHGSADGGARDNEPVGGD
jgi:hypothetical protein